MTETKTVKGEEYIWVKHDNRVVGWYILNLKTGYLSDVWVLTSERNQGNAHRIVQHAIARAKYHGLSRIWLHVGTTELGQGLYGKHGFQFTEIRVTEMVNVDHGFIMILNLNSPHLISLS